MTPAEVMELVEWLHAVNALLHDARARGAIDGTEESAARRCLKDTASALNWLRKQRDDARTEIASLRTERDEIIEMCAKVAREAAANAKRRAELLRGSLPEWRAQLAKVEEAQCIEAGIIELKQSPTQEDGT